MKNIRTSFEEWLQRLAKEMQIRASHLTPREQKTVIISFWLISLLLSFYLLFQHIN